MTNLELTRFFFAVVSLLTFAHAFGYLFQRGRMPKVIGEIFGGLLLGPTALGYFFPGAYVWMFEAFESEGKLLSLMSWLGLILLMFVSGFEVRMASEKEDRRTVLALLAGATVVPFLAGWFAPRFYDFSPYLGTAGNMMSMTIVIAIAVAVTSIPVIAKIFIDLDIMGTRFAKVVLATATIQDVILWVALAVATGLASSQSVSTGGVLSTIAITMVFFLAALLLMPKLVDAGTRSRANLIIRSSLTGYVLLICFLFAGIASILDVNIVFGAFLAGIVIGSVKHDQFDGVKTHIREMSLAFFVPLYFAIVGFKLDLIRHLDVAFFVGFLFFSVFFEALGTISAARIIGKDWLSSLNLGVAMNTRGGPGIVLATVAFDTGIINEDFASTLVLIAIVTSLAAGSWFRVVTLRGWKLLS